MKTTLSKPNADLPAVLYAMPETNLLMGEDRSYVLKVRDLPQEEKPREKLLRYGPEILAMHELLAIVLGVGTKKEEVLAMTRRLLKEYGEKAILSETNAERLSETLGLPVGKAAQVIACFEIGRRMFKTTPHGGPVVLRTARQVYEHVKDMRDLPKEHLRGLYLNSHYHLAHEEVISVGSLTANIIHPREVFRPALEYSTSALILVHNHPSGVTEASEADIAVTEQLIEAGKILGISLLDHVIVTSDGFGSVPASY